MQTTILGRTGLPVSVAGLGCGGHSRLGKLQGKSFQHSVGIVREAIDLGVTFIDTAAAYGTEEIVAEAIRGRRDKVVISTKATISAGGSSASSPMVSADVLQERVEDNLRRLKTDVIDVLHLHGVALAQYDYCRDVLLERLERLREAGKIRFTGITERFGSETNHDMAERATADAKFDVLMIGLNYVNHSALRRALPQAQRNGVGTLCMFAVRGPLGDPERAAAIVEQLIDRGEIDPGEVDRGAPLDFLTAPGVAGSLVEAAYRFCRHAPGIDVTVTGTGNPDHLRQNIEAITMPPLPDEVLDRINRIFGRVTSESGEPPKQGRGTNPGSAAGSKAP